MDGYNLTDQIEDDLQRLNARVPNGLNKCSHSPCKERGSNPFAIFVLVNLSAFGPTLRGRDAKILEALSESYSITGATHGDFETLDFQIASGVMKILHWDFRRRIFIEEERAQQNSRFMTGRQIACMIYDHFRISDVNGTDLDL